MNPLAGGAPYGFAMLPVSGTFVSGPESPSADASAPPPPGTLPALHAPIDAAAAAAAPIAISAERPERDGTTLEETRASFVTSASQNGQRATSPRT